MTEFNVAAEGSLDMLTAKRILSACGHTVAFEYAAGGKSKLDGKLKAYNEAAKFSDWFVLRDLDNDAQCAPTLLESILPLKNSRLCVRIAVREIEAWLLADQQAVAQFFAVSPARVPPTPDQLADAKQALVNLARASRRRDIRMGIPPTPQGQRAEGPGYSSLMSEFVNNHWNPRRGSAASPSLARTIARLTGQ